MTLQELLPEIVALARAAGEKIMPYYRAQGVEVSRKEDDSPLTKADLESDRLIVAGLKALTPDVPCISEESGLPDYSLRKGWPRFWLVDPLDGTKEFVKKLGDFTVNIALVEKDEPVLGVVFAPAKDLMYSAAKGVGAFKQGAPIFSRAPNGTGLVVVESASHPSPELEKYLAGLQIKQRVKLGSSLKFCLVAEGAADLYPRFGPTMEWDTAAGDCVWRDSGKGGRLESPLTYNKPSLKNADFVIGRAR